MTFPKQSSKQKGVSNKWILFRHHTRPAALGLFAPYRVFSFADFFLLVPSYREEAVLPGVLVPQFTTKPVPMLYLSLEKRTPLQSVGWEDFGKLFGFFGQFVLFLVGMSTIA